MIQYEQFTLDNGLRVIVHRDTSTPIAAVNIIYNVGAKDEHPDKTGFAHLFEHLMFGGSVNIPDYDHPLQQAGGENNAFTNNDFTNYYISLPYQNLETAFWLESDRMLGLAFSEKSLDVQRNVVIEEYKQRYLNQPYGDYWLLLRPLVYKVHPYQWATIGKDISHIENAVMDDVRDFYQRFYNPCNAIVCVAGNVTTKQVQRLATKWFGPIPPGKPYLRDLPQEPAQTEARSLTVERDVPFDVITLAYQMGGRLHDDYYTADLLSDILSSGNSSRLYQSLVKEKRMFTEMDAYISGDVDNGLFMFYGKPVKEVSLEEAQQAILNETGILKTTPPTDEEMEKVRNRAESSLEFSNLSVLNKAMKLSFASLLGNTELANEEISRFREVNSDHCISLAKRLFVPSNCSTLFYRSK